MVAIDGAGHPRPSIEDDEVAGCRALEHIAIAVDDRGVDAEKWQRRRARLELGGAGQRRDQNAAGLGLPPGIDDGAALLADHAVIPFPGFRIDRLAHAAEEPERLPAAACDVVVAGTHQRPDRRRRGIEDVDTVLVDHLPHA